jgi:hypothetical protein
VPHGFRKGCSAQPRALFKEGHCARGCVKSLSVGMCPLILPYDFDQVLFLTKLETIAEM